MKQALHEGLQRKTHITDTLFRRGRSLCLIYGYKFNFPLSFLLMLHDRAIAFAPDNVYPPDQFLPERFLDNDHTTLDPTSWVFGFGRRLDSFTLSSYFWLT